MKRNTLIITLCLFAAALQAQENRVSYSRTFTKLGGSFTVGDSFTADNLGYGLTTMKYKFFDPFTPGGLYFGFCGTDIHHTVGGVTIDDVKPVSIGWRKEALGPFGFDLGLSPVLGSRIIGDTIFGNLYLGIKPMIGTYFAVNGNIDIELAYEPVINLFNFGGSDVRNETYHDLTLYVVLKKFSLIKKLGWNATVPQEGAEGNP
ncbi:MAG: hypothetical protein CVV51_00425 [Spirochaetae bacterium HGW-Spirochaetae-7]|jgi:hypothetical protein|nr:MAG: hypothetical protein CVV51_00425 [Spirochaetae bacterium HGW-Spirochaetae-7]